MLRHYLDNWSDASMGRFWQKKWYYSDVSALIDFFLDCGASELKIAYFVFFVSACFIVVFVFYSAFAAKRLASVISDSLSQNTHKTKYFFHCAIYNTNEKYKKFKF